MCANVFAITLQTKNFGKRVAFVFYHKKGENLQISNDGTNFYIHNNSQNDFNNIGADSFGGFASNVKLAKNSKTISFKPNLAYVNFYHVNGESFTALEFLMDKNDPLNRELGQMKLNVKNQNGNKDSRDSSDANKVASEKADQINKNTTAPKLNAVTANKKSEIMQLRFPWNKLVSSAVFVKDHYLYIAFGEYKSFVMPDRSDFFDGAMQLQNQDATVLRVGLRNSKVVNVTHDEHDLIVELSIYNHKTDKNLNSYSVSKSADKAIVKGYKDKDKMISIQDSEVGDTICIFPSKVQGKGVKDAVDVGKFMVLKSFQGLAVSTPMDNLDVLITKEGIEISNKEDRIKEKEIVFDGVSILPSSKNLDENFLKSYMEALEMLHESNGILEEYQNQINLAKLYFLHGMYHESLGVLNVASMNYPEYFNRDLPAYFLTGVNATLMGRYSAANTIYKAIVAQMSGNPIPGEIAMWIAYNDLQAGQSSKELNVASNAKLIKNYHDDLYYKIVFAGMESSIEKGDFKAFEQISKSLRQTEESEKRDALMIYKGRYYEMIGNHTAALRVYKEVLMHQNITQKNNFYARFLIAKQYLRNPKYFDDAMNQLYDLRYQWRGDKLEYDLLLTIAQSLRNIDNVAAIRMYKYILDNINHKNDLYVKSEITRLYRLIFTQNINQLKDFDVVALFNDFKEYVGVDDFSAKANMIVIERLINLDLVDYALSLWHNESQMSTDVNAKTAVANKLIDGLLAHNNPTEALKVMDKTDQDNLLYADYIKRMMMRAIAYDKLGEYKKAIEYLPLNKDEPEQMKVRADISFKNNIWSECIKSLECLDISQLGRTNILKLAISYIALNKNHNLAELLLKVEDESIKSMIKSVSNLSIGISKTNQFNKQDFEAFLSKM